MTGNFLEFEGWLQVVNANKKTRKRAGQNTPQLQMFFQKKMFNCPNYNFVSYKPEARLSS